MNVSIVHLWSKLSASFWFLPAVLAGSGVGLAFTALVLEAHVPDPVDEALGNVMAGGAESAVDILTIIAGSMITVTGLVFSITIIVLSLSSQQFGPRTLRSFMADRGNQIVLGTFIGTFLYCVVSVLNIGYADAEAEMPRVVVLIGVVLTGTSIAVLIYFIHHTAKGIQADTIIARIATGLADHLKQIYPEGVGEGGVPPEGEAEKGFHDRDAITITAKKAGYLNSVKGEPLLRIAKEADLVVRLRVRPGDPIVMDAPLMDIYGKRPPDEKTLERLQAICIVAQVRSTEQDIGFRVDQLVEIAVRSLSTGINDPFTAINVVDRLSDFMCRVARRDLPSMYRYEDGHLRIIAPCESFEGLVKTSWDQLRQYGRKSVGVQVRLLESLERVAECTDDPERKRILRDVLGAIMRGAEMAGHEENDQAEIHEYGARAAKALA